MGHQDFVDKSENYPWDCEYTHAPNRVKNSFDSWRNDGPSHCFFQTGSDIDCLEIC